LNGFIFNERTNNTEAEMRKETNWDNLMSFENKNIRIGLKIASIIPNTDENTYLKGNYYIPR
jgi:hypothetical protein